MKCLWHIAERQINIFMLANSNVSFMHTNYTSNLCFNLFLFTIMSVIGQYISIKKGNFFYLKKIEFKFT